MLALLIMQEPQRPSGLIWGLMYYSAFHCLGSNPIMAAPNVRKSFMSFDECLWFSPLIINKINGLFLGYYLKNLNWTKSILFIHLPSFISKPLQMEKHGSHQSNCVTWLHTTKILLYCNAEVDTYCGYDKSCMYCIQECLKPKISKTDKLHFRNRSPVIKS